MNISQSIPSTVTGVSFSFLSSDDVRRISVKQIVNPVLLDELNRPTIGGLYDPALGPSDPSDVCSTCRLSYYTCPGHFGHIELPSPVYHPLFFHNVYNLLRGVCLFCHRFKLNPELVAKYAAKIRLLDHGLLEAAHAIDAFLRVVSPPTVPGAKAKSKNRANGVAADSQSEDEDVEMAEPEQERKKDETIQEFRARLNEFVEKHMQTAGKRDNYKDGHVYQARKNVINEFLKSTLSKRCQNHSCGNPAYTFRKEGYTKIIEYDLAAKQKKALTSKRPDILMLDKLASTSKTATTDAEIDSDSSDDEAMEDNAINEDDGEEDEESDEENQQGEVTEDGVARAANGRIKGKRGRNERVVLPEECRAHLRRLFSKEPVMCSLLYGRHGPFAVVSSKGFTTSSADIFFLDTLCISPTRFRPPKRMGETLFEHSHNELLTKVLQSSYRIRDINVDLTAAAQKAADMDPAARTKLLHSLLTTLIQLQVDVNSFMDSSKNPAPVRQGQTVTPGVKQGLEKKEGLFRKNMMGKRVNYAARSVISPDVNIEPNEIGIPPVFARKLTFPEPVTPENFRDLRQQVINGPRGYPGASMIELEDGHQISLDKLTSEQRTALANRLLTPEEGRGAVRKGLFTRTAAINKKVYRHLQDGDILILNRQPTLHKPSMMTHKARVLRGEKTIRMHYANCNSYNADFDGDEMNIHFPQNQVARAEAMLLANTDNQYLVPTSGKPLRGLIQDHVVAGVWMTGMDAFFSREDYFQLLYGALRPESEGYDGARISTLPPAIWKPKPLWTGKQIISTVLKNITPDNARGLNLIGKTSLPGHLWSPDPKDDKVRFMDGELIWGVLDKASFGAADYGLVHSVYELYGATIAGKLLGILSRLFTKFLQHRAFTCRMDDLTLTPAGDEHRHELFRQGSGLGTQGAVENFPSLKGLPTSDVPSALKSLLKDVLRDDEKMAGLDMTVKTKLSKLTASVTDACMPGGLFRKFPHNHMQTMTQSGAKGSAVNARQITCALGQQELEGRRVPVMISGKTLPSFKPFETKAIAGGYIASRFLTGIKPQEFYFHCMAGREGLIDTAVKTSRSGYLQRCLIKHLEGIRVHYDNTVRGSDSSLYQFLYGGDGLDVTKQKHLHQFDFIAQNEVSFVNLLRPKDIQNGGMDVETAADYMKKTLKQSTQRPDRWTPSKRDLFDPTLSIYNPTRFLGSTSELFAEAVSKYAKENPSSLIKISKQEELFKRKIALISKKRFQLLMNIKYMRSLVEPGEAVGLIASQGVGEPSTQMTLNTFHFAGHGAANVTLGIPRLREIVMTASTKPKTPSMTLRVRSGIPEEDVQLFCKRASRMTLSQAVDAVAVVEELVVLGDARRTKFTVTLSFFPESEYRAEYESSPEELLSCFGARFPLILKKEITSEMKRLDADLRSQITSLGKGKKQRTDAGDVAVENDDVEDEQPVERGRGDDNESEVGDGDADDDKRARQRKEQATYEDDEDAEEDNEEEQDEAVDSDLEEPPKQFNSSRNESGEEDAPVKSKQKSKKRKSKGLAEEIAQTGSRFQNNLTLCTGFDFTSKSCTFTLELTSKMPKLLLVGIVEQACRKTVVREIPGIKDCFQVKSDKPSAAILLNTNGSNLSGLWQFSAMADESILEDDDIYSNDIYGLLTTYGVEMARAAILKEVGGVFAAYSIQVDRRHLELIADYMTFDGGYRPFNRSGIAKHSSPLLKASYETTAAFLSDATLHGDFDDLRTPSGSIVLGRPNLTGTGAFDVVMSVAGTN